VSYVAVIDVPNADGRLQPGGTATVDLATARRNDVVRIPNAALAFRPSTDVFAALGQEPPDLEALRESASGEDGRTAIVWTFDGRAFTPIAVNVGIADETWTELASGPLAAGDRLVTNASVR
jgi:HlyD family secretion protein